MKSSLDRKNSIKYWAEDDRPREKFLAKGKQSLSNSELLAILIGTGAKDQSAVDLARNILALTKDNINELAKLDINSLTKVKGIGEAKAIIIAAALELGRRRKDEDAKQVEIIKGSRDIFNYFEPLLTDLPHEEFWILLLARNNKVICRKRISEGGLTGTVVDARIIFKHAIENLASSIILCHNHPSGNLKPSSTDIQITKNLVNGAKFLDLSVIDHLIIGQNGYYSFADKDII
ncbi:MAG: DNA repair protein RadC [Bacteroidota bacterium]